MHLHFFIIFKYLGNKLNRAVTCHCSLSVSIHTLMGPARMTRPVDWLACSSEPCGVGMRACRRGGAGRGQVLATSTLLASFKMPSWQRVKACFVRRGKGQVRTQDLRAQWSEWSALTTVLLARSTTLLAKSNLYNFIFNINFR